MKTAGTRQTKKPTKAELLATCCSNWLTVLQQAEQDRDEPLTLDELQRRAAPLPKSISRDAILKQKAFAEHVYFVPALTKQKPEGATPIVLQSSLARLIDSDLLFDFLAQRVRQKRLGKPLAAPLAAFVKDAALGTKNKVFNLAVAVELEKRSKADGGPNSIADLIKRPEPKPVKRSAGELAGILVQALFTRSKQGDWLSTLAELQQQAGLEKLAAKELNAALKDAAFASKVVICDGLSPPLLICKADVLSHLPELLAQGIRAGTAKAKDGSNAFLATDLTKQLVKNKALQSELSKTILQALSAEKLGPEIASVIVKGKPHFFLQAHRTKQVAAAEPTQAVGFSGKPAQAAASGSGFAADFAAVFTKLESSARGQALKLHALRQALPQYDRATFDRELKTLFQVKQYAPQPYQGGMVQLSPEELAAGIQEPHLLLTHVRRYSS